MLKGLYVISDDELTPQNQLISKIEQALKGGAKIVQLRDKKSSDDKLVETIKKLQKLCVYYNATFILNDRVDLAIETQCDGLHIGKSDYSQLSKIRKKFKGIIGVSCYGSIETALNMQDKGADYIAFGSFFKSKTKPNSKIVPVDILKKAKEQLDIPVCAIGGINNNSVKTLIQFNPDMVAVINDIWSSKDILTKATFYSNLFK